MTYAQNFGMNSKRYSNFDIYIGVGKIVLDQYIASAAPLFYKKLQDKIDFIELEKLHLGVDHTEVGGQLAEKWSFPEALVDTIRHHHYPENGSRHPELIHMVYIADLLM